VREIRANVNLLLAPPRQVSISTIQKILNDNDVFARKTQEKWRISEKNRYLRVEWCKKMRSWTLEDWAGVIFSDESKIQNNPSRRIIRIKRGTPIPTDLNNCRNKFDVSVMVWGYIMFEGPKKLVFLDQNVTGKTYAETLENHLLGRSSRRSRIWRCCFPTG
jgi:hypothetical protein